LKKRTKKLLLLWGMGVRPQTPSYKKEVLALLPTKRTTASKSNRIMAMTRKVATVFGGSGFIGRYVVKRLAAQGFVVRAAVRDPEGALFLKTMGEVGQIVPLYAPVEQDALVNRAVEGADIVINLAGILSERRQGDFYRVQAEGAQRVAQAAARSGVQHFVHVSAIGVNPESPSHYARSKGLGEQSVRGAFPTAVILRPSILFGAEDAFFNRFAAMAMLSPVLPIFGGGTKFQPVYVGDVADAVMAAIHQQRAAGKVFELGGPSVKTFEELIEYMLKTIDRHRRIVDLPEPLARFGAVFLERLPGKLLTLDQIKLLRRDNIVAPDALDLASLGITATPMDIIVPVYLARFRAGGQRAPIYQV
jgi:NADH dehydrogenase